MQAAAAEVAARARRARLLRRAKAIAPAGGETMLTLPPSPPAAAPGEPGCAPPRPPAVQRWLDDGGDADDGGRSVCSELSVCGELGEARLRSMSMESAATNLYATLARIEEREAAAAAGAAAAAAAAAAEATHIAALQQGCAAMAEEIDALLLSENGPAQPLKPSTRRGAPPALPENARPVTDGSKVHKRRAGPAQCCVVC